MADRGRCGTAILAVLISVLGVCPGRAQDLAQGQKQLQIAALAGSERLRLRAFGLAMASSPRPDRANLLRAEMIRQGYYHSGAGVERVGQALQFAPVLAWDGNINGGVWRDHFAVNHFTFEADPAYRAKSGMVAGATAAGQLRFAWDEGRIFELQASTTWAYAPKHDLGRGDLALSACMRNHLIGWSFLDLCALGFRSWRDLGNDDAYRLSAEFSQVLALGESLHDLGIAYQRASTPAKAQERIAVSLETLWPGFVTDATVTLGAKVEGATVLRERLDLSVSGLFAEKSWRLEAWGQKADGGGFLGVPRRDAAWGLGISREIGHGLTMRFGYSDYGSTAPIADYRQISLDLRFQSLRW